MLNFSGELQPDFIKRKEGTIVGVTSLADCRGFPKNRFYSASKAAASALLESLRVELKEHGIKVITVKPGFVKTPMTERALAMVESLPNGVSWANLMAGICSLRDQHASPKPPDDKNQESPK